MPQASAAFMTPKPEKSMIDPRILRKLRLAANLSQKKLAQLAHLSPSYLSHLENRPTEPRVSTLKRLSSALGVDAGTLLLKYKPLPDDPADGILVGPDCLLDPPQDAG
jgi:transcriptional regulator with XRE-family HTH domain